MEVEFIIYGKPCRDRRPRATSRGRFASVYTHPEQRKDSDTIKAIAMQNRPKRLLEGALVVEITAYFPIPKSISKKKWELMASGKIRPTKKPDFDNIAKIYCDAMNEIIYKDDSQIVEGRSLKWYSDIPRVEIYVAEIVQE